MASQLGSRKSDRSQNQNCVELRNTLDHIRDSMNAIGPGTYRLCFAPSGRVRSTGNADDPHRRHTGKPRGQVTMSSILRSRRRAVGVGEGGVAVSSGGQHGPVPGPPRDERRRFQEAPSPHSCAGEPRRHGSATARVERLGNRFRAGGAGPAQDEGRRDAAAAAPGGDRGRSEPGGALVEAISRAQAERDAARTELERLPAGRDLSLAEVDAMIDYLTELGPVLKRAEPAELQEVYAGLRLEMIYRSGGTGR